MIINTESIKSQLDIVSVIESYIPLKKAGVNYQACCPFHDEKTPSFIISPSKQIFNCFGCGQSGDVFKFVMLFNNIGFNEAIESLASSYNLEVQYDRNASDFRSRASLQEKLERLNERFFENLKGENKIIEYLAKRGLTLDDCKYFGIGYGSLESIKACVELKEAKELGLINERNKSPFAGRITFSVRNYAHKIVGFAGRTHPYLNFYHSPKYINSKESNLYKKSQNLYGYSLAKSAISQSGRAFIVEGYMDMIAAHKLGSKNVIATAGTAFNKHHLAQILRVKSDIEIILCFDNDSAGGEANLRGCEVLFKAGVFENAKVGILQGESKDIGDVLAANGTLEIKTFSAIEYYIKKKLKNAKSTRERDNITLDLARIVNGVENFYTKEYLLDHITNITKIPREYFSTKAALKIKTNRYDNFLSALFNGDEEYIELAKESLIKQALPKEYQGILEGFLDSRIIPKDTRFRHSTITNADKFYNEILNFNLGFYESELTKAKAQKDIKAIVAISEKIAELKELAAVQMVF